MKKVVTPEDERANFIKQAVERNFDSSPDAYDSFEMEHKLFTKLAEGMVTFCGIEDGAKVLDIGCGTGTSTFVLAKAVGPVGVVIGVDLSQKMLDAGDQLRRMNKVFNTQFIKCDAQDVSTKMDIVFDAALFNASIFLIPKTPYVLQAAADVIRPGGTVGFNYLVHDLRPEGELYSLLDEEDRPPLSPKLWDEEEINRIIGTVGLMKLKRDKFRRTLPLSTLRAFYSIPAQAASVFPKLPVDERVDAVEKIFDKLKEKGVMEATQEWVRYHCLKPESY